MECTLWLHHCATRSALRTGQALLAAPAWLLLVLLVLTVVARPSKLRRLRMRAKPFLLKGMQMTTGTSKPFLLTNARALSSSSRARPECPTCKTNKQTVLITSCVPC